MIDSKKVQELIKNTMFELDLFNASVLDILIRKGVVTEQEYLDTRKRLIPLVQRKTVEQEEMLKKMLQSELNENNTSGVDYIVPENKS